MVDATPPGLPCFSCAQPFTRRSHKGPTPKWCPACALVRAAKRGAARYPVRPPLSCADCDAQFTPPRRAARTGKRRRVCCDPCREHRARRYIADWAKENPETMARKWRARKHRKRAAARRADAEQFDDLEIFERDRWKCGICRRQINPKLKWPDKMCVSLDHIVPLVEGGAHTRANTRAAHWLCNSRRGERGGGEQLALLG